MRILHLVESLAPGGPARQVQLVAPMLARAADRVEVCCLGSARYEEPLRRAGIAVHALHWSRAFDPAAVWKLGAIVRELQPDVIHAWRRPALRAIALLGRRWLARTIVSGALPRRERLAWWDRWLLAQARCLAAAGASEQDQCAAIGLTSSVVVAPALGDPEPAPVIATRLPSAERRIVCVGDLTPESGYRDAIWALDILNYIYPDAHLYIAGAGPAEAKLRAFAEGLHNGRVHFLGVVDGVVELLRSADVVWLPSRGNRGRQAALEAQAQGRPVIATDVPCLREVVRDGATGFLIARGDRVALARRTRLLFEDPALSAQFGAAAQAGIRARPDLTQIARQWRALYGSVAA